MLNHLQTFPNLCENLNLIIDVIFKFGSLEKKTHQIHMNNDPCKAFKKMLLGQKN
jgi:hypothetical protein